MLSSYQRQIQNAEFAFYHSTKNITLRHQQKMPFSYTHGRQYWDNILMIKLFTPWLNYYSSIRIWCSEPVHLNEPFLVVPHKFLHNLSYLKLNGQNCISKQFFFSLFQKTLEISNTEMSKVRCNMFKDSNFQKAYQLKDTIFNKRCK